MYTNMPFIMCAYDYNQTCLFRTVGHLLLLKTTHTQFIMGRGSRPICRVGPKMPQNKMAASVG